MGSLNRQPWFLLLVAMVLAVIFLEYRVQETRASGDYILLDERLVLPLGYTQLPPEPGSMLEKYRGKTSAERGIYGRPIFPYWGAVVFGVLIPLVLIGISIYLEIRRRRHS